MSDELPCVLAIDDMPENLLVLSASLADDFNIRTATSGKIALALARESPPDLILLDVMMPEMDGFETCRRFKSDPLLRDIPVIFVTALDAHDAEIRGLELGASDYLAKPLNIDIARQRIRNLVDRDKLRKKVELQRDQLAVLLALRREAEDELRIAAAAFATQNGMIITDADGVILRVNQSFIRLTGYSAAEAIGQTPAMLRSGRHDPFFYERMWATLRNQGSWQGEIWNMRKNGQIYAEMLAITAVISPEGVTTHYVASFTDITEDKQAEAEIHRLAYYDALTHLPNRRLLQDRLGQAVLAAKRSGRHGALFFIDLDNFKALNDTRGHAVGDRLLVAIAQRLRAGTREGETVARLGGDEFVLLLENLGRTDHDAAEAAKRHGDLLREMMRSPFTLDDEYHCKVSIGVCLFDGSDRADDLFKRADMALYQAKDAGRDRLRFFDPDMQASMDLRSALEADLAQALKRDQLRLYYQPQFDAQRRPIGVEGLLRWQHPQRGMVSPGDFIPLAESTGLILPIGLWVLKTACAQLKAWAGDATLGALQISVNVSARQFGHPDFIPQMHDLLDACGANPARLKLELTETTVLDNTRDAIDKMHAIKRLGVHIAMDDFGTGYSSLSYLAQLPLDQLKIDQSFVRNLPGNRKDETIARTIITLGRELGMNVIAEGVESEAQHAFLETHGCHAYQGYLFGRPLPIKDVEALLHGVCQTET